MFKRFLLLTGCLALLHGVVVAAEKELVEKIRTDVGNMFVVSLPSNPTTGYQWQLPPKTDDKVVQLLKQTYIRPKAKLAGAGGTDIWRFKAVGEGTVELVFSYARSWEKDVPPVEIRRLKVVVGGTVAGNEIPATNSWVRILAPEQKGKKANEGDRQ
ncbi:MAG: protease inhibitor I42 family protein [Verrucomicrobiae bacterium]|nr:protease inhibitor I42 family protein [Verrucomicrobiae bacterium]